jgi:hypothetical protein
MEFTFHSSYVILECVPSTVIFRTELYCWQKHYSNKTGLLLGWRNRYKQSTVVITIWLTVTKFPYLNLKWQWSFYSLHTFFSFYHCQDIYRTFRFPHKNYFRVVLTSRWYLIYVICVYFRIDVFNIYCVVFLFCIVFLLCALCAVFWSVHYWLPLQYSLTFILLQNQIIWCCAINLNSPTVHKCFIEHILCLSNIIEKRRV